MLKKNMMKGMNFPLGKMIIMAVWRPIMMMKII